MLNSGFCDYNDPCRVVKGSTTDTKRPETADAVPKQLDKRNTGVIFKNCAPFTEWISEVSNTQAHNAKDLNIVMMMYNLREYRDNYSKTSGSS